jgi:putative ABC transport system ATP-binding protein
MVTHDSRIAAYADRILFLKDGAIVDETHLDAQNIGNAGWVADKIKTLS